ncbi:MAG: class I SAM-dependent methyltransferase [Candidatus Hodarchaeota archaeon]
MQTLLKQAGIVQGQKVLDIGFRDLRELQEIASLVSPTGHVLGIDINPDSIETAQKELKNLSLPNIFVKTGSILAIPANNHAFDLILCKGMLHEIKNLRKAIVEMTRVCKPAGLISIMDFQRFSRLKFMVYRFKVRFSRQQCDDIHPGFSQEQLRNLLSEQDLKELDYQLLPDIWQLGSIKVNPFLLRAEKRTK